MTNQNSDTRPPADQRPRIPPGQQLIGPDRWPIIGEQTPRQSDEPWTLSVDGFVSKPKTFLLDELTQFPQTTLKTDIHCVTRWSKLDVRFSGVLLSDLIQACGAISNDAKFVSFVARSDRAHSTSLPLPQALELGTLIALSVEGTPLPTTKGGPIRSVVPQRYFYKSVKWLEKIELLPSDRLGYWEANAGYHNHADPWREQRYVADQIDKRTARRLIESKNLDGLELLSLQLSKLDLCSLSAVRATLRNANFSHSDFSNAFFKNSNLSNATFYGSDLSGAQFIDCDLEGAEFSAADLSSASLMNCALFGATFCRIGPDATMTERASFDDDTSISEESMMALSDVQQTFVRNGAK